MKIKSLLFAAAILAAAITAPAQFVTNYTANASGGTNETITPAPTEPTIPAIGSTLVTWVSTSNTNLGFQDIIAWDGPVYQSQVNVANELGLSVDVWHSNATPTGTNASTLFAAPETRLRQGALAGGLISESGGGEFGWQVYDLRVGLFADGLYRNQLASGQHRRLGFEGGVFADKMFAKNSGVGLFLSEQTGSAVPLIGLNVNLTCGNSKGFLGIF